MQLNIVTYPTCPEEFILHVVHSASYQKMIESCILWYKHAVITYTQ